jgi:hypothetical protein
MTGACPAKPKPKPSLSLTRCVPAFWSRGCIFPHGSSGMSGYVNLMGMAAIYNAIQTPMVQLRG